MIFGFILGISACLIWGMIFLIPDQLAGFSPIEVALGRYFFYGLFSLILLLFRGKSLFSKYSIKIWMSALVFALVANIFYYTSIVVGIQYANPSVTALILGLSPITIALYGNMQHKICRFRNLIFPSLLIALGLVLVNLKAFDTENNVIHFDGYIWGLLFAFAALIVWTWFAVANAKILADNQELRSSDWVTMLGVATLFWVILITIGFAFLPSSQGELQKFTTMSAPFQKYLIGTAILGLACSWLGSYLWNKASLKLPVSILGQLIIFETIFGLIFVHLFQNDFPSLLSMVGMATMLIGIFSSVQAFRKSSPTIEHVQNA